MPVEGMTEGEVKKKMKAYLEAARPNAKTAIDNIFQGVLGYWGDEPVAKMMQQMQGGRGVTRRQFEEGTQAAPPQQQMQQPTAATPQQGQQPQAQAVGGQGQMGVGVSVMEGGQPGPVQEQEYITGGLEEVEKPTLQKVKVGVGEWTERGTLKVDRAAMANLPEGHPANVITVVDQVLGSNNVDMSTDEKKAYQEEVRKKNLPAFKKAWEAKGQAWKKAHGAGLDPDDPNAWSRSGLILSEIEFPPLPGTAEYEVTVGVSIPVAAKNEKVLKEMAAIDRSSASDTAKLAAKSRSVDRIQGPPKGWNAKIRYLNELGKSPEATRRVFGILGGGMPDSVTDADVQRGLAAWRDIQFSSPARVASINAEAQKELNAERLKNLGAQLKDNLDWLKFQSGEKWNTIDAQFKALQLKIMTDVQVAKMQQSADNQIEKLIADSQENLAEAAAEAGVTDRASFATAYKTNPKVRTAWIALQKAIAKKNGVSLELVQMMTEQTNLLDHINLFGWKPFGGKERGPDVGVPMAGPEGEAYLPPGEAGQPQPQPQQQQQAAPEDENKQLQGMLDDLNRQGQVGF